MEIHIKGKFQKTNRSIYTAKEAAGLPWIGEGFVFVQYLTEDIFVGDVFILEDGTEIILKEIKLQFDTEQPLTSMNAGWKGLCRFDNLNLDKIPVVRDWFNNTTDIPAQKKAVV